MESEKRKGGQSTLAGDREEGRRTSSGDKEGGWSTLVGDMSEFLLWLKIGFRASTCECLPSTGEYIFSISIAFLYVDDSCLRLFMSFLNLNLASNLFFVSLAEDVALVLGTSFVCCIAESEFLVLGGRSFISPSVTCL